MKKNILVLVFSVITLSFLNITSTNFSAWDAPDLESTSIISAEIPVIIHTEPSILGLITNFFTKLDYFVLPKFSIDLEFVIGSSDLEEPVIEAKLEEPVTNKKFQKSSDVLIKKVRKDIVVKDKVEEKIVNPVVKEVIEEKVVNPVVKEVIEEKVVNPVVKEVIEEKVVNPVVKEVTEEKVVNPVVKESTEEKVVNPVVKESTEEKVVNPVVKEVTEEKVVNPVVKEVIEEKVVESLDESSRKQADVSRMKITIEENPNINSDAKELLLTALNDGRLETNDVEVLLDKYSGQVINRRHVIIHIKQGR